jgi:uncharacterized protein (DUF1501 family)
MNYFDAGRRAFFKHAGAVAATGLSAGALEWLATHSSNAQADTDYRALVCIYLNGGNDSNNMLIPTDGAYNDYANARAGLGLAKSEITALEGTSAGHSFGLHGAMASLAPVYQQKRLAFIANAGPLIMPVTADKVKNNTALVPAFLLSHSDQTAMQQGWQGGADPSGWAGRSLEQLANSLRNPVSAIAMTQNNTLVLGQSSSVAMTYSGGIHSWGQADLTNSSNMATQILHSMTQMQFPQGYDNEYVRTMKNALNDSTILAKALSQAGPAPTHFGTDELSQKLSYLSQIMPVMKSYGYRRQVFLVDFGSFDTHAAQRSNAVNATQSQDYQLGVVANAMAGFDAALQKAGLGSHVVTFTMSDFNRTLKPASGGGSDHAWGGHYMVMGGAVQGGSVFGTFPSLMLGGIDDFDDAAEGRWVPTTSVDQIGATLMAWMGLPANNMAGAFPNLVNFTQKNLGFLTS